MYNNHYYANYRHKRLKIIFLITILSFGAITNIFSISSFYSNFAFLKDVEALKSKEYVLEYDKKAQEKNNYYRDSDFDNNRGDSLSSSTKSSVSDLSPTSLDLDRRNNYYYNNYQYKINC